MTSDVASGHQIDADAGPRNEYLNSKYGRAETAAREAAEAEAAEEAKKKKAKK
jgi:hypothetical protein